MSRSSDIYAKSLYSLAVEEKLAELDAMVNGAEIADNEIKAEIDAIAAKAKADIEGWSVDTVKRRILDDAMAQIYALIVADANQK